MRSPTAPRAGLTLVEVMVSLVLVAIGLLGIAGSSALMFRASAAQAGEHDAIRRASIRLASLGAAGCGAARDGAATDPVNGARETWRLSRVTDGAMTIEDSVEWRAPAGLRRLVVRSALLC